MRRTWQKTLLSAAVAVFASGATWAQDDATMRLKHLVRLGAAAPDPDGMILRVASSAGDVGPAEYATFGVPFAEEKAPKSLDDFVLVDPTGACLPFQWRALVRYGGPREESGLPLRFAQLTTPIAPAARARTEFTIRRRRTGDPPMPASASTATPTARSTITDNGPASPAATSQPSPARDASTAAVLTIDREQGGLRIACGASFDFFIPEVGAAVFSGIRIDGRDVLGGPAELLMEDPSGDSVVVEGTSLAIEESGPLRVVVTKRFRLGALSAVVRLAFHARSSDVRCDVRLENPSAYGGFESGLPDGARTFGSFGLRLPLAGGGAATTEASTELATEALAHPGLVTDDPNRRADRVKSLRFPRTDSATASRPASATLTTEVGPAPKGGGQRPSAMYRAGDSQAPPEFVPPVAAGALGVARKDGGPAIFAALERAEENAPKELAADARGLAVRILPFRRGDAYRLDGGRWKTQTVILGFRRGADEAISGLTRAALRLKSPLRGGVDPAVLRATGAVPALFAERGASSDGASLRFERFFDLIIDDDAADEFPRGERVGLQRFLSRGGAFGGANAFGWDHYGDIPWADGYSSLHYDWPLHAVLGFARTLDPRFLDAASALIAWRRDMGQNHTTDEREFWRGANVYEKGRRHGEHRPGAMSHSWTHGLLLWYALTGDESAYEAGREAAEFALRSAPGDWTGWWGSRIPGWNIHMLVDAAAYLGDRRALPEARRAIARFAEFERSTGGHGCVINPADKRTSPWMECIFFTSAARYAAASGDAGPIELLRRQRNWLVASTLVERSGIVPHTFSHWAPSGPTEPSVHLVWPLIEALTWSALLGIEPSDGERATRLFDALVCHWQAKDGVRLGTNCSPITFRPGMFPGTESKTLGNLLLWGAPHLALRVR